MGMDISMYIVKDKKQIGEELFYGERNSEWFNNMRGAGQDDEYDYLPIRHGFPEDIVPDDLIEKYVKPAEGEKYCFYFGRCFINVYDFKKWFNKYAPHLKAGWVNKYTAWKIEFKHYIPYEEEVQLSLEPDDVIEDRVFITYQNDYDMSLSLYRYLIENKIDDDAYIIYCFDH